MTHTDKAVTGEGNAPRTLAEQILTEQLQIATSALIYAQSLSRNDSMESDAKAIAFRLAQFRKDWKA